MPLGTPTLQESVGAASTSVTSASFTPSEGELLVVFGGSRTSAGAVPTISDSLSGTWTEIDTSGTENGNVQSNIWYQMTGASPSARTITVTSTSAIGVGMHIVKISGADTNVTNFQVGTNGAGDPSVTMSSYASGSAVLYFYVINAGDASTPLIGTELADANLATNLRMASGYESPASTTTLSRTGGGTDAILYGLEIKVPVGGSQNIDGALYTDTDTFHAATVSSSYPITGALYSDADTFNAATVSATYGITGALYTDADTFFGATVSQGAQIIDGALYTDADTFHAATVTPGSVTISGALYSDTDTFHAATITALQNIDGALFTDTDTFFGSAVTSTVNIGGALYTDSDTFFGATIVFEISGALFTNSNTFYGATLTQEALSVLVTGMQVNISQGDAATFYWAPIALPTTVGSTLTTLSTVWTEVADPAETTWTEVE